MCVCAYFVFVLVMQGPGQETVEKGDDSDSSSSKSDSEENFPPAIKEKIDRIFDQHGLSAFGKLAAWKWVRLMGSDRPDLSHAREWLRHKINNTRPKAEHPMQQGCPDIVPGLR